MVSFTDLPQDASGYVDWPVEQLEALARPLLLLQHLGSSPFAEGINVLTNVAFAELQNLYKQLRPIISALYNAIIVRDEASFFWDHPSFAPEYQHYLDANDYRGLIQELTNTIEFDRHTLADEEIDNIMNRIQREVGLQLKTLLSHQVGQTIWALRVAGITINMDAFQPTSLWAIPDMHLIINGVEENRNQESTRLGKY